MKNKNHFFISYSGNKRNETDKLIPKIDFNNKNKIIETFCGTSAISFHIWLEYGNQFEYYLNDNSKSLMSLYELFKNNTIDNINDEIKKINDQINNKEEWNYHYKNAPQTTYKELFYLKFSTLGRKGFYPQDRKAKKEIVLTQIQELFIKFIQAPYVYITCDDWYKLFNEFKDDEKAIIIFDPPYINSNNDFYLQKDLNIYQWFYDNNNTTFKSSIYFILEDIWIIRLLFNKFKALISYDKKYELSKKHTKHIILTNKF